MKTKFRKKVLALLFTFTMLFSLNSAFGSFTVNAATDRVSMYLYDLSFSKYGIVGSEIYIQTKDNASNQQVYVYYNPGDGGEWQDEQAAYFTTLSDGSKIWKAHIQSYSIEYAIKYVADGQIFWDNNNGKNYTGEKLGSAPITVHRHVSYMNTYVVTATLQNYSYNKNVQVRYTTDDWATYKDVPLSYKSTNSNGTEVWSTNIEVSNTTGFEYCVYYEVDGQTYWSNNFGENYDMSYRVYP